jgi:hypothetical protein
MSDTDDRVLPHCSKPASRVRARCVGAAIHLLAILVAASAAVVASNNWCFVLFPAALAGFFADYVVCAIRPAFIMRLLAAVLVGSAVGLLLNVGPGWAFREAFEMEPPAGVRDVRVWRHYAGGPGEHVLIIEFTADSAAFETLIRQRTVVPDSVGLERWRAAGGEWAQVLDNLAPFGITSFARSSWGRIRPLERPEAFDLGGSNRGTLTLFREPDTGRCVALHVRY